MAAAEFIPFVPKKPGTKYRDRAGDRYGKLVAIAPFRNLTGRPSSYWLCQCDCGNTVYVVATHFDGRTRSCGCLRGDSNRAIRTTHGMTHTTTHHVWKSMVQRCTNPKNKSWNDYGGRGIALCDNWRIFANFLADMGACPPGMSIERHDNNAGYHKDNCHWATRKEQNNNKRSNVIVEYAGKRMNVSQLAEQCGIAHTTLRARLRLGWTVDRAATEPVHRQARKPKNRA